jgi:hypothetical protein
MSTRTTVARSATHSDPCDGVFDTRPRAPFLLANEGLDAPFLTLTDFFSTNWHRGCCYLPRHGGESIHISEELNEYVALQGLDRPECVQHRRATGSSLTRRRRPGA